MNYTRRQLLAGLSVAALGPRHKLAHDANAALRSRRHEERQEEETRRRHGAGRGDPRRSLIA